MVLWSISVHPTTTEPPTASSWLVQPTKASPATASHSNPPQKQPQLPWEKAWGVTKLFSYLFLPCHKTIRNRKEEKNKKKTNQNKIFSSPTILSCSFFSLPVLQHISLSSKPSQTQAISLVQRNFPLFPVLVALLDTVNVPNWRSFVGEEKQ